MEQEAGKAPTGARLSVTTAGGRVRGAYQAVKKTFLVDTRYDSDLLLPEIRPLFVLPYLHYAIVGVGAVLMLMRTALY